MRKQVKSIFLILFFCCFFVSSVNAQETQINFNIRAVKVTEKASQEVHIPKELFEIWKTLQSTLNYEVGGGLDFNLLKQLERIKLTIGQSKKISYIPDFEVAWHTHPAKQYSEQLRNFIPPSPSDIQISLAENYNLWLVIEGRNKTPKEKPLVLKMFSAAIERPVTVELNIVVDTQGVYLYRAAPSAWEDTWLEGSKKTYERMKQVGIVIQTEIQNTFTQMSQKLLTPEAARAQFIRVCQLEGVEIRFYPWEKLLAEGLDIKLDVAELLAK